MFDKLRNSKDSILLKIFLGILTLSFGIWGVGDFLGTSGLDPSIAIRVGSTKIPTSDIQRQYNQEVERLRTSNPQGAQAVQEPSIKRSILDRIVQQETRSATMNAAADKMGLEIPDSQMRETIHLEKAFQDSSGEFSATKFGQFLSQNNMSERSLINLLRADLREDILLQTVAENSVAPKLLSQNIFDYRAEMRTAETILVPAANMAAPQPPSDDDIKKLYDKNIATFTAPEYRKITAIILSASDLAKPDAVDEAEMKTYYDQNKDRYRSPAKRHIVQVVFSTKEKAEAARAAAEPTDTLATLAARIHAGPVVDLGDLQADSPMGKTIAPAFSLTEHEISQPVETDLGWHLFEATSITPESTMQYEDVKDKIRTAIAQEKATDEMYEKSVQLEDSVSAGTPLATIAKTLGARLVEIPAMDHDGKDPQGTEVPNLSDRANVIRIAFSTAAGADSGLKEFASHDGYYVVKVDAITPPSPKPLDAVRTEVTALWDKQERMAEAKTLADKIAGDVGPSDVMTKFEAADKRVSYALIGPMDRTGQSLQPSPALSQRTSTEMLDQLFTAKVGDVFAAPVTAGMEVTRLKAIVPADSSGQLATAFRGLDEAVKNGMSQDIVLGVNRAYAARYPAEINNKAIDDLINPAH